MFVHMGKSIHQWLSTSGVQENQVQCLLQHRWLGPKARVWFNKWRKRRHISKTDGDAASPRTTFLHKPPKLKTIHVETSVCYFPLYSDLTSPTMQHRRCIIYICSLRGYKNGGSCTCCGQVPVVLQHHISVSFLWKGSSTVHSSWVKSTATSAKVTES